jgi:hypothetical protein
MPAANPNNGVFKPVAEEGAEALETDLVIFVFVCVVSLLQIDESRLHVKGIFEAGLRLNILN